MSKPIGKKDQKIIESCYQNFLSLQVIHNGRREDAVEELWPMKVEDLPALLEFINSKKAVKQ